MNKVKLICHSCGVEFERKNSLHQHNVKTGKTKNTYCSRKCCGKFSVVVLHKLGKPDIKYLKEWQANKIPDGYEPFRPILSKIKSRKNLEINIDLNYLKNLWEIQNGRCALTGWEMILRPSYKKLGNIKNPYLASIDRINSKIGYIKGNIRFVCYAVNIAKNIYEDSFFVDMCNAISFNLSTIKKVA